MKSELLRDALASVIGRIRAIGPDAFRAEIAKHQAGDIACALRELEVFASFCIPSSLMIHSAVNAAIMWGATLDRPFEIADFEEIVAANDSAFAFALAA